MLDDLSKKYAKDNTTELSSLLKKLAPTFKDVDTLKEELRNINESDIKGIRTIGKKILAAYGDLYKSAQNLHALRHNKRVAYKYARALEYENGKVTDSEGKPMKATADKLTNDSELYIADERKVYYAIEGYLEWAKISIMFCQSLIKGVNEQVNAGNLEE